MMRRRFAMLALFALALGTAMPTGAAPTPPPTAALTPTPVPSAQETAQSTGPLVPVPTGTAGSHAPIPPTVAPARPVSTVNLKVFTGQLLDIRSGYAFFTTGDAFKIIPAVRV